MLPGGPACCRGAEAAVANSVLPAYAGLRLPSETLLGKPLETTASGRCRRRRLLPAKRIESNTTTTMTAESKSYAIGRDEVARVGAEMDRICTGRVPTGTRSDSALRRWRHRHNAIPTARKVARKYSRTIRRSSTKSALVLIHGSRPNPSPR